MSLDTAAATVKLNALTVKFDRQAKSATPYYPEICKVIKSKGASEDYAFLGAMSGVREWLGERQFNQLRAARFNIPNRLWEDSFEIEKTDFDDDKIGLYEPAAEELADELMYHPDELVINELLLQGDSKPCFDGQFFFDTDHSWGSSGSQSNKLTYNADATPTAAQCKAAFNQARVAMLLFKTDKGKKLNRIRKRKMDNLSILVHPDMEQTWADAMLAVVNASGASNVVIDAPKIVVCPEFTDPLVWYLLNLDGPLRPFVFQERSPWKRGWADLNNPKEKTVKYMADGRYACGYFAWWMAIMTTFN